MLTGVVAKYCKSNNKKFIFAGASNLNFMPDQLRLPYKRDKYLYEWGLKNASNVLVQNQEQKTLLKNNYNIDGVLLQNIANLPNGLVKNNRGKIAWVGAIRPAKSPLKFIELATNNPDLEFIMIGGPGDVDLWNRVNHVANDVDNLELMGHVQNHKIGGVLKHVSVLVNTSDVEGFPNTFLEAWSRGIPTISFVKIHVSDNIPMAGIVVSSLKEMGEILRKFKSNEKYWADLSMQSQEIFHKWFTFASVIKKYRRALL